MKTRTLRNMGMMALVLTLITSCLLGGTLAKYTSTVTGTSTATVATWGWEINDTALASGTTSYTFNLFSTVKEADTTTAEADVASGKIAPGTGGSFAVKIDNISDVDATYAIDFSLTNANNIPLEFSLDGTTWKTSINDIDISATNISKTNGTATKTVYWRWVYETVGGDAADTALGFAGTATATVTAAATFTQAD
jgi:hypothetical protein